jgi:hypothetical protein
MRFAALPGHCAAIAVARPGPIGTGFPPPHAKIPASKDAGYNVLPSPTKIGSNKGRMLTDGFASSTMLAP